MLILPLTTQPNLPCMRRRIPIVADTYVDREFGTGALKITPGHDPNDYEIGRRVGLSTLNIMNDDGTLNTLAGAYAGLDRFDARKRIWADLQACSHALLCMLLLRYHCGWGSPTS